MAESPRKPRCLVVDTDMDLDDAMALTYTCVADAFDLRAVTASGTGFMPSAALAADFARRLLQLCNATGPAVPVAAGLDVPFSQTKYSFATWYTGLVRQFFDEALPPLATTRRPSTSGVVARGSAAARLLIETAEACLDQGRRVDIVALGPLTNLAEAVRIAPALMRAATAGVYFSGGNLAGKMGNSKDCGGRSDAAECNVFMDVAAMSDMLSSGIRMHFVDIVAFQELPVPRNLAWDLAAMLPRRRPGSLQHFFVGTLQCFLDKSRSQPFFYDPAVAVWRHERVLRKHGPDESERLVTDGILGDIRVCKEHRHVTVRLVQNHSEWYGALELAHGLDLQARVDICTSPDRPAFMAAFLEPLFGVRALLRPYGGGGRATPRRDVRCTLPAGIVNAASAAAAPGPEGLDQREDAEAAASLPSPPAATGAAPGSEGADPLEGGRAADGLPALPAIAAGFAALASGCMTLALVQACWRGLRHGVAPDRLASPLLTA